MVAFQYTKKDTKHLCGYTENVLIMYTVDKIFSAELKK